MGEYNFSEDMRTAELTFFTFNMRSPLKLVRSSICVGINEKATKPHTSLPIATISYPIHSSLVSAFLEEAPLDAFHDFWEQAFGLHSHRFDQFLV